MNGTDRDIQLGGDLYRGEVFQKGIEKCSLPRGTIREGRAKIDSGKANGSRHRTVETGRKCRRQSSSLPDLIAEQVDRDFADPSDEPGGVSQLTPPFPTADPGGLRRLLG